MNGTRFRCAACLVFLAGGAIFLLGAACSRVPATPDPDGASEASPSPTRGRWRQINGAESRASVVDGNEERLLALPYLQGYHIAPDHSGVTIHDEERSYPGLNFYTSGHAVEAGIMDMHGNILHRWNHDAEARFETLRRSNDPHNLEPFTHWRRARLYENGEILAIYGNILMIKLSSGFIRQNDQRFVCQCIGQGHSLLLSSTELICKGV